MKTLKFVLILLFCLAAVNSKKRDPKCDTVKCPANQRCQDGKCLMQLRKAMKNLCMDHKLAHSIKPIRCTARNSKCTGAKNVLTCGFTNNGLKKDFTNDCSPCLDTTIDYFYKLPCSDAPAVCKENEQCVNGKCLMMFDSDTDVNRIICNSSSECKPLTEICVANKCVQKKELFATLSKHKAQFN